jgi:hypothetical protein
MHTFSNLCFVLTFYSLCACIMTGACLSTDTHDIIVRAELCAKLEVCNVVQLFPYEGDKPANITEWRLYAVTCLC